MRDQFGDYRVISMHTLGNDAMRVKVENLTTGAIEYRVIPLP